MFKTIDTQISILNVLLMEPKQRNLIFKELAENYFVGEYRTIFNAFKELYLEGKAIDAVTITSKLNNGYMPYISQILESRAYASNISTYISILKERYAIVKVEEKIKILQSKLKNENINIQELQEQTLQISKLFNINNKVKLENTDIQDILKGIGDYLESPKPVEYYKTGFEKLDKCLLIDKGELIIIGGRPSSGKTTFATNIAVNLAKKHKVLFFSLETGKDTIGQKIAAMGAKLQLYNILTKKITKKDIEDFKNLEEEYKDLQLKIIDIGSITVKDIAAITLQEQANIVFIDYIGLIESQGLTGYEQLTRISKELRAFAQDEKVTIFALSQLKRLNGENEEPTMSDLRESGQIEQDANAILLLHNPNPKSNNTLTEDKQIRDVIIAKNKKGRMGTLLYDFYGATQIFKERHSLN